MAVTPTTLTELNDLAKDYFTNVYVEAYNPDTPLKAQFEKLEDAQFTGKKWIFGVKTSVGGASANVGANKTLPEAEAGQFDQGDANVVRTYTRMALDGLAIEVTKKQTGSFKPALREQMEDRLQAHDLEVNRQLYNKNASVATVSPGATSTVQTLINDYDVVNGGLGTRHLYVGDRVEFYTNTFGVKRAGGPFRVTVVDHAVNQITVHASVATTTNDVVVRATADTDNSIAGVAGGLLTAVSDTGTFENIPATTQAWKAIRLHNSGTLRDISDALVMQAIQQVRSRSRKTVDLAVTRPGIVLKYSELFLPLRRLDGQDVQLVGGYKPIAAIIHAGGAIPVIGDEDCPSSRLFLLTKAAFRLADMVGTQWADMDGAQFDRVTDKDAIEGYIRKYWQLITIQRNANAVIEDLFDISAIEKVA